MPFQYSPIAVFDYAVGRSMLSCNHGVHEQQRKAFADTNLLFARALNNFSTGWKQENDVDFDPQNSLLEDFKENYSGKKSRKDKQIHGKLQQTVEWLINWYPNATESNWSWFITIFYCTASSASGEGEPNPALWLATRAVDTASSGLPVLFPQ